MPLFPAPAFFLYGSASILKKNLNEPVCCTPNRNCRLMLAPGANGVRKRYRSRTQTAVMSTTHSLRRWFLQRGSEHCYRARWSCRRSRSRAGRRIRDSANSHARGCQRPQIRNSSRNRDRTDIHDAEPQSSYRCAGVVHEPSSDGERSVRSRSSPELDRVPGSAALAHRSSSRATAPLSCCCE